MNPKISIIVPVYNVEKYIEKCIDSILVQSFKDFELILVNDGSTDNSGKICDHYLFKDNRVKVIHKENGGQSSARNLGVNISRGEYIGFVDSDDWIEKDMYEILYNLIIKSGKNIANIGFKIIDSVHSEKIMNHGEILLNKEQAIEELILHKLYGNYIWANLYKAQLLKEIKFNENIVFEDIDIMYKLLDKSNGIITFGEAKYNYLQRKESTVKTFRKYKNIDLFTVLYKRNEFLKKEYNSIYLKTKKNMYKLLNYEAMYALGCLLETINNKKESVENKTKLINCSKIINSYFLENILNSSFTFKEKIMLIILKINLNIYINLVIKCKKK